MTDVKAEDFSSEVGEFLDKNVSPETRKMLASLECEDHKEKIKLVLDSGNLDINACCEDFAKVIQQKYLELESSTG
ncbi:hypothetical protein P0136_09775 [Lentisphaerota bacterium ZTH]|nr:hypothetical protein JYG24_12710 [Lentisphaerota bacterium]WET05653.1 hypothetical protein P0136_09775 [Lentisphaerota bacterium ZTH]